MSKSRRESYTEQVQIIMPEHINGANPQNTLRSTSMQGLTRDTPLRTSRRLSTRSLRSGVERSLQSSCDLRLCSALNSARTSISLVLRYKKQSTHHSAQMMR